MAGGDTNHNSEHHLVEEDEGRNLDVEDDVVEEDEATNDSVEDLSINDDGSSICAQLEKRLTIDNEFDDLEQAYSLYCEYGRLSGFSVRKGDNKYFSYTKEIRCKEFLCSCEGTHDAKSSTGVVPAYKKQITRSNCKARIRLVRPDPKSNFKVQRFDTVHNHELAPCQQSYLLRSARKLTHGQKVLVESMKAAGIGVSRACRFLEKESGGPQNLGFTRKDVYNHLTDQKLKTNVQNVDANALVEYFATQANKEPYFYWKTQLDDEGRLMNFFFRDYRCLIDYEHFGDVLSVDTTYKTNRYDLICAPFIGLNHHKKNVMFGLAFLSNETTRTFEWLFDSFLESMYGKEPLIVFSDQGGALCKGINLCFKTAKHRLCQWHISRNAPSHFGTLNEVPEFKKMFRYCMKEANDSSDFDQTWSSMISTYGLEENRWFAVMYKLRKRWATAFTNDIFSAGLLATSRSEVTNKVLKDLCTKSSSLYEFLQGFLLIVSDWRLKESVDDFNDLGTPGIHVSNCMILVQASKVLTRSVYLIFADQASSQISVGIMERPTNLNDEVLEFKVASQPSFTRIRTVRYNRVSHMAHCSCRLMETSGIICRHMFRVFLDMNITRVPDCYFLPRWRKTAKHRHPNVSGTYYTAAGEQSVQDMSFVNHVVRMQYSLAELAKKDANWKKRVLETTEKLRNDVFAALGDPSSTSSPSLGNSQVRDPARKRPATASIDVPTSHWKQKKPKKSSKSTPKTNAVVVSSQQTVSSINASSNHEDDDAVGRAVWEEYNSVMLNHAENLDTPIDVTSIFQTGTSNTSLSDGQRFFI